MKYKIFRRMKFLVVVVLCTIPPLYMYIIAEDRYQSVSHFSVVVEESNNAEASMGMLKFTGGGSNGTSDSQIATSFISSSDLLLELQQEFDLFEHYSAPRQDFIFALSRDASKEAQIDYYRSKISANVDAQSGIIVLTVESFSPELSKKMSDYILLKTEEFINNLNKEIANKRLSFVQSELERAQKSIKENKKALLEFQNKSQVIKPESIIQAQLEMIQTLRLEKINKETELAILVDSSPIKKDLESSIEHLDNEIKKQEAVLSGPDAQKLNQILAQYKELQLNLESSLKLRKGAELVLEKTRAETIATSRFFSVIQNPYLSEASTHPRRLYISITSILAILLITYVIRAIVASIYDRA